MGKEFRKAIAVHHTDVSDASWDGPANEARLKLDQDEAYYRKAYAWQDPEGDPKTKAAYKFIHHEVDSEGNIGPANVRACSTGIAVLNGARGGTNIPDADREGVYNHLAAHLRDADMEPPELKRSKFQVERRAFPFAEIRVEGDSQPKITGYAAVFNSLSEDLGMFREIIRPGAFAKTIQEADIRGLVNHDPNYVLGRTRSGTLKLAEDERGLAIQIIPPDTQWAKDLMVSMRRGDINQMSFGFYAIRDRWQSDEQGMVTRELLEVKLFDVSVVTFPAYPETQAQVRSAIAELQASIDALRTYLPIAPLQEGHPMDAGGARPGQGSHLRMLKRRLEIAEKAI